MSCLRRPVALTVIAGITLVLDACAIAPPNLDRPGAGDNRPGISGAPAGVSDLYNSAENYAKQQLRGRGFNQVDAQPGAQFNNTWWLNTNTDQCFQLKTASGKVMTLTAQPPPDCRAPDGAQNRPGGIPQAPQTACLKRFGEPGYRQIKTVTARKPGYWEVIISGRQVACTVDQYGSIADWVNMQDPS